MCVIIAGDWGAPIPTIAELRAWQRIHPHGWGWAWITADGSVAGARGLGRIKIPRALKWLPGSWMVHLRLATAGTVSRENAHPFKVGEAMLAHNGTMSHLPWAHGWNDWSDTRAFSHWLAHVVLPKRGERGVRKAIRENVGRDRIALLGPKGLRCYGPGWHNRDGRWYTTALDPSETWMAYHWRSRCTTRVVTPEPAPAPAAVADAPPREATDEEENGWGWLRS